MATIHVRFLSVGTEQKHSVAIGQALHSLPYTRIYQSYFRIMLCSCPNIQKTDELHHLILLQHPNGIGAKWGGTQEQCSQKLFELAEVFGKIIKIFIINEYILCKIKKISPYSNQFLFIQPFD
jgi:hypothetical protein